VEIRKVICSTDEIVNPLAGRELLWDLFSCSSAAQLEFAVDSWIVNQGRRDGSAGGVAYEAVHAVLSNDHSAEAGDAALREIIARVASEEGDKGPQCRAFDLTPKLAGPRGADCRVERLAAVDLADILFLDLSHDTASARHSPGPGLAGNGPT
jgi:hypothetical protein